MNQLPSSFFFSPQEFSELYCRLRLPIVEAFETGYRLFNPGCLTLARSRLSSHLSGHVHDYIYAQLNVKENNMHTHKFDISAGSQESVLILGYVLADRSVQLQGFIQDFSKKGGNHLTPPTYQETVPITNVFTARIHLWKKL